MTDLTPLESLFDPEYGPDLPLPPRLRALYGRLRFPFHGERPYVLGNFVTTLDGVVSMEAKGLTGGGEISGYNQHDRMVMGILRAAADAVVVGAGTLRSVPQHLWTADYIFPSMDEEYRRFRVSLGKPEPPLNVVVTERGAIDLDLPVFASGRVASLIATTPRGARRLAERALPPSARVTAVDGEGSLSARSVLEAVNQVRPADLILVEGGPRLMGDFLAEGCLDELFLTLAPQVAGRVVASDRPGLVAGRVFGPDNPLWATLVGVKRADSHLFLRYSFLTPANQQSPL